jgi:hypothetical protein
MATKTIILRPSLVTASDVNLVTLYPSDTTFNTAYLLVNEETADDAATYISCSIQSELIYTFYYNRPIYPIKITDISIHARHKAESAGSLDTSNTIKNTLLIPTEFTCETSVLGKSTEYIDFNVSIDNKEGILQEINNMISDGFTIKWKLTMPTGTKDKPIRTTQIYITITYEDLFENFYIKNNDNWEQISGIIYAKYGDTWKRRDLLHLQDGRKYFIHCIE